VRRKEGEEELIIIKAAILCAAVALTGVLAFSSIAETVTVGKSFNGREIKVRVGAVIRVQLEELGAAGYVWAIKDLDTEHFEVLDVQTGQPPQPGEAVGAPLTKTWLIKSRKEGKSELRFLQFRPWEGEKNAVETFVLKVRIL
jgi:predicted secreted protein